MAGLVAVFAVVLAMTFTSSFAAQKADKAATKKAGARLPNYYGKVSTEEQKDKLREIAQEYAPRIKEKRDELAALIAERDAALDKILTAEQRKELARLREAAAAASRDAGSGDSASSSDEASESTTDKAGKSKSKSKKAA
jgi:hypothetical protein